MTLAVTTAKAELHQIRLLKQEIEREKRRREGAQTQQELTHSQKNQTQLYIEAYPFYHFVEDTFPILEPGRAFFPNWHIDIIGELLQASIMGEVDHYIVNIPRRSMKSLLMCVMFPAWVWTFMPHLRFLYTSYSAGFAARDNKKTFDLVTSEYYQQRWGNAFQFTTKKLGKELRNNKGGFRIVFKIGKGTGEGGDFVICLWYNTLITTDKGQLKIGDIVENKLDVKVLSFNHETNEYEYKPIAKYEKSKGRESVEIRFSNGEKVQCTFDHPFFVSGKGYIKASDLQFGDKVITDDKELRNLQQRNQSPAIAFCAEHERRFLLSRLPRERSNRRKEREFQKREVGVDLPNVQPSFSSEAEFIEKKISAKILLQYLQRKIFYKANRGEKRNNQMRLLRQRFSQIKIANQGKKLLQSWLRFFRSSRFSFGQEKRQIRSRSTIGSIFTGFFSNMSTNSRARLWRLPIMRFDEIGEWQSHGRSPYRLRQVEQRPDEFNQSLPLPSRSNAWFDEKQGDLSGVFIVSVKAIPAPESVYNIQIQENHNYFANSILAHNCDDPNSIEETESDTMLDNTNRGWDETSYNNVANRQTAVRGIIQQRTNENDLTGHILDNPDTARYYEHLCLPMRLESDHPHQNTQERPLNLGKVSMHEKSSNPRLNVGEPKLWIDPRLTYAPDYENNWYREWYKKHFREKGYTSKGVGQLLWENYVTEEIIERDTAHLKAYGEASQLQQRPIMRGGNYFNSVLFEEIPASKLPLENMIFCRSWDKGGTDNAGDPTIGFLMARTKTRPFAFYLVDMFEKQISLYERMAKMKELAEQDTLDYITGRVDGYGDEVNEYFVVIEKEGGASGMDITTIEIDELMGYEVQFFNPRQKLEIRAKPVKSMSEGGRIKVVKGFWNQAFYRQLERFKPERKKQKDDMIVTLVQGMNKLMFRNNRSSGSSSGSL